MTDEFISEQTSEPNGGAGDQHGDNFAGNTGETVDTKSVEHQLNKLQQRVDDKDAYITQLENEGKTFREALADYEARLKSTEEITKLLEQSGQEQNGANNQETALDENAVADKVINTLSKREAEQRMNQNFDSVMDRVREQFGDAKTINEKMRQFAQENGMTVSDMKETARKSPKAFYKLVGMDGSTSQAPQSPQPSRSTQQAFDTGNSEKGLEYYSNLMRTNWKEYIKPENQREYRRLILEQNKKQS